MKAKVLEILNKDSASWIHLMEHERERLAHDIGRLLFNSKFKCKRKGLSFCRYRKRRTCVYWLYGEFIVCKFLECEDEEKKTNSNNKSKVGS